MESPLVLKRAEVSRFVSLCIMGTAGFSTGNKESGGDN